MCEHVVLLPFFYSSWLSSGLKEYLFLLVLSSTFKKMHLLSKSNFIRLLFVSFFPHIQILSLQLCNIHFLTIFISRSPLQIRYSCPLFLCFVWTVHKSSLLHYQWCCWAVNGLYGRKPREREKSTSCVSSEKQVSVRLVSPSLFCSAL